MPDEPQRSEVISVGAGDDNVVRIQLAARWAERFAPRDGDSLHAALQRFKHAYDYLDAVTHGMEPAMPERDPAAATPQPAQPGG